MQRNVAPQRFPRGYTAAGIYARPPAGGEGAGIERHCSMTWSTRRVRDRGGAVRISAVAIDSHNLARLVLGHSRDFSINRRRERVEAQRIASLIQSRANERRIIAAFSVITVITTTDLIKSICFRESTTTTMIAA